MKACEHKAAKKILFTCTMYCLFSRSSSFQQVHSIVVQKWASINTIKLC